MHLPIGISNFKTLITETDLTGNHYLFVDKTLFIYDILNNLAETILITRPRRFGKTLNMSMLYHFLSAEIDGRPTQGLFNNLKVAAHPECMQHQGKYPVIFLTFKDIKSSSFEDFYASICNLIGDLYESHEQILLGDKLTVYQKKQYRLVLEREAVYVNIKTALLDLTFYVYQHYGVKPIVLIDEYDTPIQTAYVNNYYQEMIDFMREFLSSALKDNAYLQKAVLTGILRIAKESLFSGLNNIKIYSLLDSTYGEYFGFTEPEVAALLEKTNLSHNIKDVKIWYNGYQAGDTILYNPWSIINYLVERGKLSPYWINTSNNTLVKELLINSSAGFKEQFETLLQDNPIEKLITENFVFTYLTANESLVWSLLLMSGYLKITSSTQMELGQLCKLEIPNNEVKILYRVIIAEWLSGVNDAAIFNEFLTSLLVGKIDTFVNNMRTIMLQTFSVHDVKGSEPEKFYHGFMLGLLAGIDRKQYNIESNKESGLGRYDIAIIPNDTAKLGIVLELKSLGKQLDPTDLDLRLQEAANIALQQIDHKQYVATMQQHRIKHCLKVGVAFGGKELAVVHRMDDLT